MRKIINLLPTGITSKLMINVHNYVVPEIRQDDN